MKLEKINDNQVKCTLTSFDLSVRNLNLAELSYGSESVRNLFSEMMQKAYTELGFEVDGTPLMIEAIPNADESIVLVISKVEEPEEVDTRFSRFSPVSEELQRELSSAFCVPLLEGITELLENNGGKKNEKQPFVPRVFIFDSLDRVSEAAARLNGSFEGRNSLYKKPNTKEYHLILEDSGFEPAIFASTCNALSEYGRASSRNYSGKSYYDEHYELIIKSNALEVLAKI